MAKALSTARAARFVLSAAARGHMDSKRVPSRAANGAKPETVNPGQPPWSNSIPRVAGADRL